MLSVGTLLSKTASLFIFTAGPLFNLIMFFIGICPKENLALAFFNLMPIMPLDGGMIISLLFPNFTPYISIIFIAVLLTFCIFTHTFPLLPIVLTIVFIISEKSKTDRTISDKIMSHFRQK